MGDVGARREELVREVLAPLVLGGAIRPVRPIGARLALALGDGDALSDGDLQSCLDVARVRRARLLAPVDALPPIDPPTLALVAALNDLLQLTNQHLGGALTAGRYTRLLANAYWLCGHVRSPRTVEEALSRHATLARVLELQRTDTDVAWWTGASSFRGERPPPRLLAWPELRRVRVDTHRVPLTRMASGSHALTQADFLDVLARWLPRSPLTDLATATRAEPAFAWSPSTLGLIATRPGRSLAFRALLRQPAGAVSAVLTNAAQPLVGAPRALADDFANEVAAGGRAMQSA